MKPKLPNGATILSIDYDACVVLAFVKTVYGGKPEYATWAWNADQGLRSTSNGHYLYDLAEAKEDFAERCKRGY